jgi:hypothetical protein
MEENKTYRQQYYKNNKEKFSNKAKNYYEKNKEKIAAQRKIYYEKNKTQIIERQIKYSEKNKEKIKNYDKIRKNKENITPDKLKIHRDYNANYTKNRRKNDVIFKFKHNISCLIRESIKRRGSKKLTKSEIILGCTLNEFKIHIESLWKTWMNWDNYGNPKDGIYEPNKTWDFDHIIPMKEGKTEIEIIKLNHYTNIQPMCSYYNRFIKIDNIIIQED